MAFSRQKKKGENPRETHLGDGNCGVSEEKELVDAGNEDSPHETDDPSPESGARHRGIIRVGDRGSDFRIWRLLLERRRRKVEIRVVIIVDGNVLRTAVHACVCVNDN